MASKIMEYMRALDRKVKEMEPRQDVEGGAEQVLELQTLVNVVTREYSSTYPSLLALMQKANYLPHSFYIVSFGRGILGNNLYKWKLDEAFYDWDSFMLTFLDVYKKIRYEEGELCDL